LIDLVRSVQRMWKIPTNHGKDQNSRYPWIRDLGPALTLTLSWFLTLNLTLRPPGEEQRLCQR